MYIVKSRCWVLNREYGLRIRKTLYSVSFGDSVPICDASHENNLFTHERSEYIVNMLSYT